MEWGKSIITQELKLRGHEVSNFNLEKNDLFMKNTD